MDSSPKGREIRTVEGDPSAVISRGNWIETLGGMMEDCAQELQTIATHDLASGEMDGKAVEKLQDKIGDSWETLREAAQLYKPVGPIIATYGEELQQWQPLIRSQVDTCEDLWAKFDSMEGAPTHLPGAGPEEGSPEAQQEEDAEEAKDQARKDWENAAETWDGYYDSWEDAYDAAVSGIGNEMSGKIEDGFWEVLDDIIAVLEIVALVVLVLGIFLTGPFAAIAFAISAAVFAMRAVQYCAGECSLLELGLAALDVVPFGKFGAMADAMTDLGANATKFAKFSAAFKAGSGFGDMAWAGRKAFPDMMTALHTGLDIKDFERIASNPNLWAAGGEVQGALAKYGNSFYSSVQTVTGMFEGSFVDVVN
ncbi:hypothetical protein ACFWQC_14315 [Nocardioides sp. NPDC058538]|uniref:hypothetical protein n=1 Tax=Nocardioides sp. NPDC058538 TaxID=3346542 RepID=UPI0036559637